METVFTGIRGLKYPPYQTADLSATWNDIAGNYAFIRLVNALTHRFDVLYFGECENFNTRPMPPFHERWEEAVKTYGATHLLARVNLGGTEIRRAEERDLIAAYNPPMNVQHRTGIAGAAVAPGLGGLFGHGLINRGGKQ